MVRAGQILMMNHQMGAATGRTCTPRRSCGPIASGCASVGLSLSMHKKQSTQTAPESTRIPGASS